MQKKWIFLTGIVLLFLAASWGFYWYQKPREGVAAESAAYRITAEQLYQEFAQNETTADKKYTGKVIAVKGAVSEVQATDSALMVLLSAGNDISGVNCSFYNNQLPRLPQKGAVITVKGRCTGFLMDVNLVDAVLQE